MKPRSTIVKHELTNAKTRFNRELATRGPGHRDTTLAQAALFEVTIKKLERKQQKILDLRRRLQRQGHTIEETRNLRMESREIGEQINFAKTTLKEIAKKLQ